MFQLFNFLRVSHLREDVSCLPVYYCIINGKNWYGHVLRKDDDNWVKKCMEYEVEGSKPRGRPKRTWKEVVREDCQARKLNKEDAVDKWRKVIKEVR